MSATRDTNDGPPVVGVGGWLAQTPFTQRLVESCNRITAANRRQLTLIAERGASDGEPRPIVAAFVARAQLGADGSIPAAGGGPGVAVMYAPTHADALRCCQSDACDRWQNICAVHAGRPSDMYVTVLYMEGDTEKRPKEHPFIVPVYIRKTDIASTCCHDGCPAASTVPGDGVRLMCSGCQGAYYCSAACQNADWGAHKRMCKINRMLRPSSIGKMYVL